MARVEITRSLYEEIDKRFKAESINVLEHLRSLEDNPSKGKTLGTVGGIVIKELKYKSFRFYFLADGFKLKILSKDSLIDLLMRFVRMSDKKHQQQTIDGIKKVLREIRPYGFD